MASYVVLTPPGGDASGERTLFIRDGFAFLALVLPIFWFLWHRLWLAALLFVAIVLATNLLMASEGWYWTGFALSLAASLIAGLEGQQMRIAKRERQGWSLDAVIEADDLATAEALYFAERPATTAPPAEAVRPVPAMPRRRDDRFGLFEWNGGR